MRAGPRRPAIHAKHTYAQPPQHTCHPSPPPHQNIRKGDFSRAKVSGKRAIDLGSGMGLAGLALALLGADVVLTDVREVLPLLRRNTDANLSPAALRGACWGQEGCNAVV